MRRDLDRRDLDRRDLDRRDAERRELERRELEEFRGRPDGGPCRDRDEHDRACFEMEACSRNVRKEFMVSVPVTIRPTVNARRPEVECLGGVEIRPGHRRCRNRDRTFRFTVTQNLAVNIPIEYCVETCYGRECLEAMDVDLVAGEE